MLKENTASAMSSITFDLDLYLNNRSLLEDCPLMIPLRAVLLHNSKIAWGQSAIGYGTMQPLCVIWSQSRDGSVTEVALMGMGMHDCE